MNTAFEYKPMFEDMVIQYLPLVRKIVDQMNTQNNYGYDRDDLISIGVLGLIDAIRRFDRDKGIPFRHYAKWRIKGTIIDELRRNGKVSRDKIKKLKRVNQARNELQQKLLREPLDREICEHLSISNQEFYEIQDNIHYLSQYSLEEILFVGEEREFQLKDVIEDQKVQTPEEDIVGKERIERLTKSIERLKEREQLILNLYYKEELTLKEIGEILNISLSRVSQIHGKILIKLRNLLETI